MTTATSIRQLALTSMLRRTGTSPRIQQDVEAGYAIVTVAPEHHDRVRAHLTSFGLRPGEPAPGTFTVPFAQFDTESC